MIASLVASVIVVGIAGWALAIVMIAWNRRTGDPFADPIEHFLRKKYAEPQPVPTADGRV